MSEQPAKPTVCIIGAGAVGLGFAAHLSRATPVAVLARSNKLEQLKRSIPPPGVTYTGSLGSLPFEVSSLWICTKAYGALDALKAAEFMFSPAIPIVLMPNGLGVYQECAEFVARRAPIVRALVSTGFLETLDEVVQSGPLRVSLASAPEHKLVTESIRQLLETVGAQVVVEPDIATAEWKKVLLNVTTNPICTLIRAPNNAVVDNPALRQLAREVLDEVRSIAAREGFQFPELDDQNIFDAVRAVGPNRNSQLIDIERGRKSEIDYLLGRLIRIAQSYDIAVPRCETLYTLCKALEKPKPTAPPLP